MKTKFNFLKISVPFYVLLITVTVMLGGFYFVEVTGKQTAVNNSEQNAQPAVSICVNKHIRENDFKYIKPLLLTDLEIEDPSLNPIKQLIASFIEQQKANGIVSSASVYLRALNDGNWITINNGELYSPGSLMKVPTLITYLKYAETNPAIMDKEIFFKKHFDRIPQQTITGQTLVEGRTYKVRDLLYYMVVYSDNDATALLNSTINFPLLQKLFGDLQLNVPRLDQQDYLIDVADYSRFFRVLFNATYLDGKTSESALEMLTKSTYKEGFVRDIDSTIVVAHKFGERNNDGEQELHEFGIFYVDNNPYLLGVMTKGKDHTQLPIVLSGISKIVFDEMKNKKGI